jgi:DNA mismatch repair protein MutS2
VNSAISKLEFDCVREALARHCSTQLGKSLARALTPTTRFSQVREWFTQVRELMSVWEEESLPPMAGVHDVRAAVRASAQPIPLEPDDLVKIAETLAATRALRAWFSHIDESKESLKRLSPRIHDLGAISDAISESIDARGEVYDHASTRLASIRRSIEDARSRIRVVFDRILRQTSITKMLQYGGSTFHNDRMVLPLKSEQRGRIPGIIHRASDSGATLFVEPAESVELNNTIIRLKEEEQREITRILQELTRLIRIDAERILDTLRAMAVIDLLGAKCKYAKQRACICPDINEDGVLDLRDARHPVLIELFAEEAEQGKPARTVVAIDVRLGDDFDVLMITGPNTGGKTVTLKTVGLIAMMSQCGIPVPVSEGSRLPVYKEICIDIGDEQSLQQSLSTFSSHMATLLPILQTCGSRTLVLIDELGAGTDPDEGAAIGRSIIAELLERGAKAMVTTHLSALKAVAFQTDRVDNAAVEFDPATLKPTYHLKLGEPGNSNALIIAQRLGMSARLVKRAKSFLDDRNRALNQAIAGTLQSRREAEQARKQALDAAVESKRQSEQFEKQQEALRRKQEAFVEWTTWVNALKPGDSVFIRPLDKPGKVVRMQLHKQVAVVSAGAMDLEVPLREIGMVEQLPTRVSS